MKIRNICANIEGKITQKYTFTLKKIMLSKIITSDMIGPSSESGTTFYTGAIRSLDDGLFYFQDRISRFYTVPITEGFSMLKFTQPGF